MWILTFDVVKLLEINKNRKVLRIVEQLSYNNTFVNKKNFEFKFFKGSVQKKWKGVYTVKADEFGFDCN